VSETLVLNPRAMLKLVKDGEEITAITVNAPVKGRDLHVSTIARAQDPELFGFLLVYFVTQGGEDIGRVAEPVRRRLADIGFLIPDDRISTRVWFTCDLHDLPTEFVPSRASRVSVRTDSLSDLVVAPSLRHFGRDGFPAAMRGRLSLENRFHPERSWLWIESDGLAVPSVYSYADGRYGVLDELRAGEPPPALEPTLRQNLLDAGVIGSSTAFARARETRTNQVATARYELKQQRYTVLPDAIPPFQLAAIRRYYRDLIAEGFLPAGDKDWPDRHFSSRDPIAFFFHQQLNEVVAAIAGEPVKPSFLFFASYRRGSQLPRHRDREQCEYAITTQLDFSPIPDAKAPWPIWLQAPHQSAASPLTTELGGAVLYFGCEVAHHREPLTQGDYSRHWFFFYVPENFTGPLD
jgi:hypothetical protein